MVVVISRHWEARYSELGFLMRSLAGAASRSANVTVLTCRSGPTQDGAFDLLALGEPGGFLLPDSVTSDSTVFVDDLTVEVATLLSKLGTRKVYYFDSSGDPADPSWQPISLVPSASGTEPFVKLYVPVNPHAARHRHNGFGFTGYQLVLSGRALHQEDPPPAVAWLTAGLHDSDVVVVEDGIAYAWRGRALRGTATVDSRMDLWRLVAHASACVDVTPGRHLARECVEAMRFGTPVIVPTDSGAATVHAAAGGSTFRDPAELLEAAASFRAESVRTAASDAARDYADANYGSPTEFVRSLNDLLSGSGPLCP